MRFVLILILSVGCAEEMPSNAPGKGVNGKASKTTEVASIASEGKDDAADLTADADKPVLEASSSSSSSSSPSSSPSSSSLPEIEAGDLASETVTAPSNISGIYLSCVVDEDRVPNGIAVDCVLLDEEKKPADLVKVEVEYLVDVKVSNASVVSVNLLSQSAGHPVEFLFESLSAEQSAKDIMNSTFRAKLTDKGSGQILGNILKPGEGIIAEFIKNTVAMVGGMISPFFPKP